MTITHLAPLHAPKIAVLLAFIACVVIAVFAFLSKSKYISFHLEYLKITVGSGMSLQDWLS